jgi:hypothetical protein
VSASSSLSSHPSSSTAVKPLTSTPFLVRLIGSTSPSCCHCYPHPHPQVGDARLAQDNLIAERFVTPWQATLSTSIGLAMKARANVKTARLELDGARAA